MKSETKREGTCCNTGIASGHHPDHSKCIPRLNRIQGQIEGVRRMIENQQYCPDILVQIAAVRAALKSLESVLLERHLEQCVTETFSAKNKKEVQSKIQELVAVFKKG